MNKIKLQFAAIFLLLLGGCYMGIPIKSGPASNNNSYNVEYLFEHDGCKVYRFYDRGEYVYFTNCQGTVTSFTNDSIKTPVINQVSTDYHGN